MSASGCRASENFDISSENYFFPIYVDNFCDAGQVPILRNFEACTHLLFEKKSPFMSIIFVMQGKYLF